MEIHPPQALLCLATQSDGLLLDLPDAYPKKARLTVPSAAVEGTDAFITLAISLGLGLLVGMQRERSNSQVAGFRTFGLITVFGSLSYA